MANKTQTVKGTLRAIRDAGMSASHRDGEYRVSYPAHQMIDATQREDTAYYTNDATDAVSTAMDMRRREDARQNAIDEDVARQVAIREAIETNRRG